MQALNGKRKKKKKEEGRKTELIKIKNSQLLYQYKQNIRKMEFDLKRFFFHVSFCLNFFCFVEGGALPV
jgi:hypothetical protein